MPDVIHDTSRYATNKAELSHQPTRVRERGDMHQSSCRMPKKGYWCRPTIFKMTQGLRAGIVWANTFNKFDLTSPFGGYKESGVGREGGLHGLDAYVKLGAG
jgi:acyl-CoA reductase-like NAD-dependent aldehyde dehydrogenase